MATLRFKGDAFKGNNWVDFFCISSEKFDRKREREVEWTKGHSQVWIFKSKKMKVAKLKIDTRAKFVKVSGIFSFEIVSFNKSTIIFFYADNKALIWTTFLINKICN